MPLKPILQQVYCGLSAARACLYQHGWLTAEQSSLPLISVGNISFGGSGKTPLTSWIINLAKTMGYHPILISRGYGRDKQSRVLEARLNRFLKPQNCGDETFMLLQQHHGLTAYNAARRSEALRLALASAYADQQANATKNMRMMPSLAIMDDGFQHLRLQRDLNLLLFDAEAADQTWWREGFNAMNRADAIVINSGDKRLFASANQLINSYLRRSIPIFNSTVRPQYLVNMADDTRLPLTALKGRAVGLISGIAHPQRFENSVARLGANIKESIRFRDHYHYPPQTLRDLREKIAETKDWLWLTTAKDSTKLLLGASYPLFTLAISSHPDQEFSDYMRDSVTKIINRHASNTHH